MNLSRSAWALALGFLWLTQSALAASAKPVVVLDPGHGGIERGVKADGLEEAAYTLDFCQRVADALKKGGVDVRLTRDQDVTLSPASRTAMARSVGARALISIHVNHSFNEQARGLRVFVPGSGPVDEPSAPLWEQASRLHAAASKALGHSIAVALGDNNPKAVQSLKLALFRGLAMPAAHIELDYASDAAALAGLKDAARRDEHAAKVARGVLAFVRGKAAEAPDAVTQP